jgi:prepilin-type N-terminal cleavage/methylation domain-containing protein
LVFVMNWRYRRPPLESMTIYPKFRPVPASRPKAFSLVELLVVIALIAVLAGFVMAASSAIQAKMLRSRAEAFLAEIQGGLDGYKFDHGTYPINRAEDRQTSAKEGGHVLYKYLSGDFDLDGEFDLADSENKIYVDSLDFKSSQRQGKGTVGVDGGGRYVAMDAFGNLIRYLCDPPNLIIGDKQVIRTLNPTYDLWSLGGAVPDKEDIENKSKWITNWGANWKAERLKGWKAERLKGWNAEMLKCWNEGDLDDPGNGIYVDSLDFESSQRQGEGTVGIDGGGRYVAMDAFGNLVRYLCDPPNLIIGGKQVIRNLNPSYDL